MMAPNSSGVVSRSFTEIVAAWSAPSMTPVAWVTLAPVMALRIWSSETPAATAAAGSTETRMAGCSAPARLHLRGTRHLRDARPENAVGRIVDRTRRHGVGRQRQDQHRRIRRVQLAEGRRRRQPRGQVRPGRVDRRLHVPRGGGDRARQVELHDDAGAAEARSRGEFRDARDLAEPPLQRRRDRGGHDDGVGTRLAGADRDGREINLRQWRDRQVEIGDDPRQGEADRQQRGADRPRDEGGGYRHPATRPVAPAGDATAPPPWLADPPSPGR